MSTLADYMHATRHYRVKSGMTVVPDPSSQGGDRYLKQGQLLPGRIRADWIDRALELGLIEEITDSEAQQLVKDTFARQAAKDAAKPNPRDLNINEDEEDDR